MIPSADSCQQEFLVELEVNQKGDVEKVSILEPQGLIQIHPMVHAYTVFIRRSFPNWKFKPAEHSATRNYPLELVLGGMRKAPEKRGYQFHFEPPNRIYTEYIEPTVLLMEHNDDEQPNPICSRHRIPMEVERIPISSGLPRSLPSGYSDPNRLLYRQYFKSKKYHFPNAQRRYRMGCFVGSEKEAEVYTCYRCKRLRTLFFLRNPEYHSLQTN